MTNCSDRRRQMRQHVQHQNERKLPVKPEALVECADVNTRTMLPQVVNHASRWLNSLNISKFKKAIKEQAVTAAHVENSAPSPHGLVGSKDVQQHFFPRTPPPMALIQFAIRVAVVC